MLSDGSVMAADTPTRRSYRCRVLGDVISMLKVMDEEGPKPEQYSGSSDVMSCNL